MPIRKYIALFTFLILWPLILYAATRTVTATGNWSDTGTWLGGNIPVSTDDVLMNSSTGVTVQAAEDITAKTLVTGNSNTITVNSTGQLTIDNTGLDALTTNNNTTIVVDGTMIINGNMVDNNSLFFTITGTVIINGDLIMANNATIDVDGTGTLIINGSLTGNNNTDVNVDGEMEVNGDINVGNNSDLTGTGTLSVTGSCTDGSSSFCESSVLPIKLISFSANALKDHILLKWTTSEEENFDYFCVEKSISGTDFLCIGEVKGQEWSYDLSHYDFKDLNPYIGRTYYRLKAVDLNGFTEYHKIVKVEFYGHRAVDFYPNPSKGIVSLRLNFMPETEQVKVKITEISGREISSFYLQRGVTDYRNLISLDPGQYMVHLTDDQEISYRELLVVH